MTTTHLPIETRRAECLAKIERRFTNLDQKVFARRWLAHKLNGGEEPRPSNMLTTGQARMVRRVVNEIMEAASV